MRYFLGDVRDYQRLRWLWPTWIRPRRRVEAGPAAEYNLTSSLKRML